LFLAFKTIRTALVFSVGPEPVPNFRMIERHYFKVRRCSLTPGYNPVLTALGSSLPTLEANFAIFQGISNGGQRSSTRQTRVNRRSGLP
jgi:hypothetical protein